jgi:hypothetical protein
MLMCEWKSVCNGSCATLQGFKFILLLEQCIRRLGIEKLDHLQTSPPQVHRPEWSETLSCSS